MARRTVRGAVFTAVAVLCVGSACALSRVGSGGLRGPGLALQGARSGAIDVLRGGSAGSSTPSGKKRSRTGETGSGGVSKTPRKEPSASASVSTPTRRSAQSVPVTPVSKRPLSASTPHTPRTPAPNKTPLKSSGGSSKTSLKASSSSSSSSSSSAKPRQASPGRSPSPMRRHSSASNSSRSALSTFKDLKARAVSFVSSLSPPRLPKLPAMPKMPAMSKASLNLLKMPSRAVLVRNASVAGALALVAAVVNAIVANAASIKMTAARLATSAPRVLSNWGHAASRPFLHFASLFAAAIAYLYASLLSGFTAATLLVTSGAASAKSLLTLHGRPAISSSLSSSLTHVVAVATGAASVGGNAVAATLSRARLLASAPPRLPPAAEFVQVFVGAAASVPRAVTVIPLTLQDGLLSVLHGVRGEATVYTMARAGQAMVVVMGMASAYAAWQLCVLRVQQTKQTKRA